MPLFPLFVPLFPFFLTHSFTVFYNVFRKKGEAFEEAESWKTTGQMAQMNIP